MEQPVGRRRLVFALSTMVLLFFAGLLWAFSATLNPSDATILAYQQRIDVSGLAPGQLQRLDWEGGEVLILRRTPGQIEGLRRSPLPASGGLRPVPFLSDPRFRSRQPEFFVGYVQKTTFRNLPVLMLYEKANIVYPCDVLAYTPDLMQPTENTGFAGGFLCTSGLGRSLLDSEYPPFRYDVAGRSFSPYVLPLEVPHYVIEGNILTLGVRE